MNTATDNPDGSIVGRLGVLIGFLVLVSAGPAQTADVTAPEKQLDQVRGRINTLHSDVKQLQQQEKVTNHSVAELQRSITQLERDLDVNKKRLAEVDAEAQSLEKQNTHNSRERAEAKIALRQLTAAAYVTYRRSTLAVALGQNNPSQSTRLLHYARTLHASRLQRLNEINTSLASLRDFARELDRRRASTSLAVTHALSDYQRVSTELEDKKNKLVSYRNAIVRAEGELKELKDSQQRLETTLAKLAREAAERSRVKVLPRLSDPAKFNGRLARDQGKLPWPVTGPVLGRFGEPRGQTDVPWRGVVISASPGTPVRAIAPGKVIFADILRGFGYMIIVDHSENYMSLYGYNEKLLKKLGDRVKRGEAVGQVGIAPTLTQPGLYFELRYQGRPVDPVRWFAQR